MNSFQKAACRKGREKTYFILKNLMNIVSKWSKSILNDHVNRVYTGSNVMWWKWHRNSVVFLSKTRKTNLIMRELSNSSQWRYTLYKSGQYSLRYFKVIKSKLLSYAREDKGGMTIKNLCGVLNRIKELKKNIK
jgi:hypothetical protein